MHTIDLTDEQLDYLLTIITAECVRADARLRNGELEAYTPEALREHFQHIRTGAIILGRLPLYRETFRAHWINAAQASP